MEKIVFIFTLTSYDFITRSTHGIVKPLEPSGENITVRWCSKLYACSVYWLPSWVGLIQFLARAIEGGQLDATFSFAGYCWDKLNGFSCVNCSAMAEETVGRLLFSCSGRRVGWKWIHLMFFSYWKGSMSVGRSMHGWDQLSVWTGKI